MRFNHSAFSSICVSLLAFCFLPNLLHAGDETTAAPGSEQRELAVSIYREVIPLLKNKEFDKAQPFLERALEIDPECYQAALALARLHEFSQRMEDANAYYNKVKTILSDKGELEPDAQSALKHAEAKLKGLGQTIGKVDEVRQTSIKPLLELAQEHENGNRLFSAMTVYRTILDLDPTNLKAHQSWVRLRKRLGDTLALAANVNGWQSLCVPGDMSDWKVRTGLWEPLPDDQPGLRQPWDGHNAIYYKAPTRRNLVLSAEVFLMYDTGGSHALVLARTQPNDGAYGFGISLDYDYDRKQRVYFNRSQKLVFFRRDRWGRTHHFVNELPRGFAVRDKYWHRLELECDGKQIVARLDGREVKRVEDDTFAEGGIGLQGKGNDDEKSCMFRNVRIFGLP